MPEPLGMSTGKLSKTPQNQSIRYAGHQKSIRKSFRTCPVEAGREEREGKTTLGWKLPTLLVAQSGVIQRGEGITKPPEAIDVAPEVPSSGRVSVTIKRIRLPSVLYDRERPGVGPEGGKQRETGTPVEV